LALLLLGVLTLLSPYFSYAKIEKCKACSDSLTAFFLSLGQIPEHPAVRLEFIRSNDLYFACFSYWSRIHWFLREKVPVLVFFTQIIDGR
jgi:hypothetical protein